MRRLFIIRKDLHLSAGKMSAMIAHCSEAYWTNMIRKAKKKKEYYEDNSLYSFSLKVDSDIMENYIEGDFVKTLCEAKNLNQLLKVKKYAKDLNLIEGIDYGFINDKCLTELVPENADGTCTVGVWFKPLSDEISHEISRHYQLYKDNSLDIAKEEWFYCRDESVVLLVQAMLDKIRYELYRLYWNKNQKEMNSPFDNSGVPAYKNNYLIIRSYYWGDDDSLINLPNFETDKIKVYWYKHSGRGVEVFFKNTNNIYESIAEVLYKSIESLNKDFKEK